MSSPDVLVVGGGVIGLASSWLLAREGLTVTVLDAGALGGQSSQAAAGILGPLTESVDDGPLTRLLWESLQAYPGWIEALSEDADRDPEWERSGIRQVFPAEARASGLQSLRWRRLYDPDVVWQEAGPGEPWSGAVWSPHEGQLYGPAYLDALGQAGRRRGVAFRAGETVTRLVVEHGRSVGVVTRSGARHAAGSVMLAAGAWTGRLWGREQAVFPVRGQVMGIVAPERPFSHVRFGPGGYIVPKRSGLVIVGATEDHSGFDPRITATGLVTLSQRLRELAPELEGLPFKRAWAGLRPATSDGLPILGPDPEVEGLFVATGHYRNGLLLSPITAQAIRAWVQGTAPRDDIAWDAFSPARFA